MSTTRRLLATAAAILAAAVAAPTPALAHASLALMVNNDGRGSMSVDVTWADGHPVAEPIAGTLLAIRTDGAQVGPTPLTRLPGASTLVHEGTLRPGTWQVTVDVALPAIGHCVAPVIVAAADTPAEPGTTRCAASPQPAAVSRAPDSGATWPVGLTVVLAVAGAAAVIAAAAWWRAGRP
ncbi:hypothetical protein AB0C12_32965 [Actinoplanes sp. NPDC048967]|uniref:hypothetical protein n=1 Tax=Actinoplanes sp. NPDC048967 TaxID=3155269 RepID=UPI0033C0727A